MYADHFFYPLHYSNPSSPTVPLDSQSTQPTLSAVYTGTYPSYDYGGYNTDWGPEHQQALLRNANQMIGGEPSIAGMAAKTNSNNCQCKWLTNGIVCSQDFDNFNNLMDHVGRVHGVHGSAADKLVCQWWTDRGGCGKKYRRDGFRRHIGTHVGCSVPCTECGKPFSRKDSMVAHRKKQHGKN